jgi:CheY-like chemotaxis protein
MGRILAVDDDDVIRRVLELTLRTLGEVTVAANGIEAVELLETEPTFDCVILDLDMPRMGGSDVVGRMKADDRLREVPIVLLTSYESAELERELRAKGVTTYLTKPIDTASLRDTVAGLIGDDGT